MVHDLSQSIVGVTKFACNREDDQRGSLSAFVLNGSAVQWNLVRSAAGVLRGMHAHAGYDEFYVPIAGRFRFALVDARRRSATFGVRAEFDVTAEDMVGFCVPAGVAHGTFFYDEGILGYGLSACWDGKEEFACRWNDPDMGLTWPVADPVLSHRDAQASTYVAMVAQLNPVA